mmetsp:Transcript_29859/g.97676  ORF Transcript_29859/g.97676 Transcript_29859/m.97676 type:complete len:278 (+) Transcript_29859:71-904(+)
MKLVLALLPAAATAFAPPAALRAQSLSLAAAVAEEVTVDAAAEVSEPSPKEELLSVVGTAVGDVSSDLRASVTELLLSLEPANPTEDPATSPLLNGVWDVAFSGYAPGPLNSPTRPLALALYAGGFTPGVAGLSVLRMLPDGLADVGDLTITISRDQPRVEASTSVTFAGVGAQELKVATTLEAETGVRLKETYASLSSFGRDVDVPANLRYERTLYVTYLDDELLVCRDDSGVPEVLLRKGSPEGAPASGDEDVPDVVEDDDDVPDVVEPEASEEA